MATTASSHNDSASGYRIEHLKGAENYLTWSVQLKDHLIDHDLWDYPDGKLTYPDDTKPVERAAWTKSDHKALSQIRGRVTNAMMPYVLSAATSKECWDALKNAFLIQGPITSIILRRKLFRYVIEDGANMEEEIRSIRSLKEQYVLLGNTLEDKEFALIILTALPDTWDSFISSIDPTDLDPVKLIGRILQEDQRRRSRPQAGGSTALVAFKAPTISGKRPAKPKSKFRPGVTCHNCGRVGHIKPECRSPPNPSAQTYHPNSSSSTAPPAFQRNYPRPKPPGTRPGARVHFTHTDDSSSQGNPPRPGGYAFAISDVFIASPQDRNIWLADSGASTHVCNNRSYFKSDYEETPGQFISGAGSIPALGRGSVDVIFINKKYDRHATLCDVIYAPDLPCNLVSIGSMTDAGCSWMGIGEEFWIDNEDGVVATGYKFANNLYKLEMVHDDGIYDDPTDPEPSYTPTPLPPTALVARTTRTWYEWHCALGHINKAQLKEVVTKNLVIGIDVDPLSDLDFDCTTCIEAKHTRRPFPQFSHHTSDRVGDLTHMDIWGPARTSSIHGNAYFISFTDDKSRNSIIFFLKLRSGALDRLQQYQKLVERQFGFTLKRIRTDNALEFTAGKFKEYLNSQGIILETTAPYSPSQNGIAERLNRTLVEHARAMLHARDLPLFLWEEAISYACYLKNRLPTRALANITPYAAFWGKRPDLGSVQEFGVDCWVLKAESKQSKLENKSEKQVFVGQSEHSGGWKYYSPSTRQVLTSRNIIFLRNPKDPNSGTVASSIIPDPKPNNLPPQTQAPSATDTKLGNSITKSGNSFDATKFDASTDSRPEGDTLSPSSPDTPKNSDRTQIVEPNPPRRSNRNVSRVDYKELATTGKKVVSHDPPSTEEVSHVEEDIPGSFPTNLATDPTIPLMSLVFPIAHLTDAPTSLREVMARPDWIHWKNAMDKEINQLLKYNTYVLEEAPPKAHVVRGRWVYLIKRDSQGNILKYKARYVYMGNYQIPGLDFFETYAPVMRLESLRVLFAIAAGLDWEIHQCDVTGAYLNAELTETVYMQQPQGYEDGTNRVARLLKAIYGLKQAGRAWNIKFNQIFIELLGFTRINADFCVYMRRDGDSIIIVIIHVDDMAIFGSSIVLLNNFKNELRAHLDFTDGGDIHLFVGLQISRDRPNKRISLTQSRYIDKILERFGMEKSNPVHTPVDTNIPLIPTRSDFDSVTMIDIPYAAAIGSLMYAAIATRPDISFAVQTLSQFTSNPSPTHWTAVKRVFRYLKGTQTVGLTYGSSAGDNGLTGYSDANWGQNLADRRSISGYAFLVSGGLVSWSSKKQPSVALSTMESEYIALAHATKEAIWLRQLLSDLGFPPSGATTLYTDNLSAISFAHDNQFHARSKHIDIRHHFVRDKIDSQEIAVPHCASEDNCADIFTKALARPTHSRQLSLLNISAC